MKKKAPSNMHVISMEDDIQNTIKQARIGIELWRYILYSVIILLVFEMLISNPKKEY